MLDITSLKSALAHPPKKGFRILRFEIFQKKTKRKATKAIMPPNQKV